MHPTIDEQLQGVRRLLDAVAADPGLTPTSGAALADATRLLRRIEGTWARVLPFLVLDTRATAALLDELAPLLPEPLATDVRATVRGERSGPHLEPEQLDPAGAAARNVEVRTLLSAAIAALPDDEPGRRARRAVVAHARRRLEADPLNARAPKAPPTGG